MSKPNPILEEVSDKLLEWLDYEAADASGFTPLKKGAKPTLVEIINLIDSLRYLLEEVYIDRDEFDSLYQVEAPTVKRKVRTK